MAAGGAAFAVYRFTKSRRKSEKQQAKHMI
jgi:hypothetical protein